MIGPARVDALYTGDARCTFPYSPAVVEGIKAMVPSYCRSYDPDDRAWTVSQPYVDRVIDLIMAVFPEAIIDARFTADAGTSGPSVPGSGADVTIDTDYAELHLLPTAPPELITVAYRCLARLNHPDTGGSTAAMQRLNEAVAIVRARRDLEATA